jgi:hypothetical protein
VVFAGSAGDAGRPSADCACGYINFFATARAARAWARRHPEVTGTLLTRQGALDIGIAEFGTLRSRRPRRSIVPLPAATSRSPCGRRCAIGFAEPRPDVHSPGGFGAREVNGADQDLPASGAGRGCD